MASYDPYIGGFGILETGEGREIYFHRNRVLSEGFAGLNVRSRVTFAEEVDEKRSQASTVKLLRNYGLRP